MLVINIDLRAHFADGHSPTEEDEQRLISGVLAAVRDCGLEAELSTLIAPPPGLYRTPDLRERQKAARSVVE